MKDALLLFVKAPRPGLVKTRLAAVLGPDLAAAFYQAMAERVANRTRHDAYASVVFYDPPEAGPEMEAWMAGGLVAQSTGDLGARMSAAFAWAFSRGAERVALIGTDAPEVERQDVAAAFEALGAHDLVLGPSLDGGYYLIGLRRPCPALFDRMSWSTTGVLGETLRRAEEQGLRVAPLPARGDIDTIGDVRREWPRLRLWLPGDLASRIEGALAG